MSDISPEKIYLEKKSIVLYSSAHTLCGFTVQVGAKLEKKSIVLYSSVHTLCGVYGSGWS